MTFLKFPGRKHCARRVGLARRALQQGLPPPTDTHGHADPLRDMAAKPPLGQTDRVHLYMDIRTPGDVVAYLLLMVAIPTFTLLLVLNAPVPPLT